LTAISQDKRWTRRKEARAAELLTAALDLFVERGYSATRLDDVAACAGVSKGTLYLYYESKEDLFKAVVREGLVPAIERGERIVVEHQGGTVDLLRKVLYAWWDTVGSTRLGGIQKLIIAESGNFPDLAQFYFDEVIARGLRMMSSAIRRGVDSGEFRRMDTDYVVRLVVAPLALFVVWRHSFAQCDAHTLEPYKYIDHHLSLLIDGLSVNPEIDPRQKRGSIRRGSPNKSKETGT
jgi:AcrR family transcriptional regulator